MKSVDIQCVEKSPQKAGLNGSWRDALRELLCTTKIDRPPGGPLLSGKVKVPALAGDEKYLLLS